MRQLVLQRTIGFIVFQIALHEPQIAPNAGNIIRLCSNNGCHLHLIEPMGFDLEEKKLRRAGLDYRDLTRVSLYPDYSSFIAALHDQRIFACTTKGGIHYDKVQYRDGDVLLFGSETTGLPPTILESFSSSMRIRIPMCPDNRSLNLSNAVAIVSYEAWRQHGFAGGA